MMGPNSDSPGKLPKQISTQMMSAPVTLCTPLRGSLWSRYLPAVGSNWQELRCRQVRSSQSLISARWLVSGISPNLPACAIHADAHLPRFPVDHHVHRLPRHHQLQRLRVKFLQAQCLHPESLFRIAKDQSPPHSRCAIFILEFGF